MPSAADPLRLVFFGSGEFGLPTLRAVREAGHEVALVVSQPDRPAGRKRQLTPTPIAEWAAEHCIPTVKPENVNERDVMEKIHAVNADVFVIIAFGQKLSLELLGETFAINLHGSLLPKYRGAAPVQRAVLNAEEESGLSVITLAQRMDAGEILAMRRTKIDPMETAGELHDRLALLGPEAVLDVLDALATDTVQRTQQDEAQATRAPKLTKEEGTVDFAQPARLVQARIHGLNPWPGCTVELAGKRVQLCRVEVSAADGALGEPGAFLDGDRVACGAGAVRLLEVKPAGGRCMSFEEFRRGLRESAGDARLTPA